MKSLIINQKSKRKKKRKKKEEMISYMFQRYPRLWTAVFGTIVAIPFVDIGYTWYSRRELIKATKMNHNIHFSSAKDVLDQISRSGTPDHQTEEALRWLLLPKQSVNDWTIRYARYTTALKQVCIMTEQESDLLNKQLKNQILVQYPTLMEDNLLAVERETKTMIDKVYDEQVNRLLKTNK